MMGIAQLARWLIMEWIAAIIPLHNKITKAHLVACLIVVCFAVLTNGTSVKKGWRTYE
jgi:hypothetical protein